MKKHSHLTSDHPTLPQAAAPLQDAWAAELVEIYRSDYGRLVHVARQILCDASLAEDCVQEAFVAFHVKEIATLPGRERAYLRSMVRNGAISRLRRETRSTGFTGTDCEGSTRSAEESALGNLGCVEIVEIVQGLSGRQGEVIKLSLNGLSVGQTARALRISVGTVKTHRHRAATTLRSSLACRGVA